MSAAVPVQDAVYAALVADAALTAWLAATTDDRRIYEVLAPAGKSLTRPDPDAPPDQPRELPHCYVTIGGGREGEFNMLCEPGYEDALDVRVWAPGTNERLAKQGHAHVRRVLDGAALPVDGHVTLSCRVGRMGTQTDPDRGATQAYAPVEVVASEVVP